MPCTCGDCQRCRQQRQLRTLRKDIYKTLKVPTSGIVPDADSSCNICPNSYFEGNSPEIAVKLPCGHHFGMSCALNWLSQADNPQHTCPNCRRAVVLGPVGDGDEELVTLNATRAKLREAFRLGFRWICQRLTLGNRWIRQQSTWDKLEGAFRLFYGGILILWIISGMVLVVVLVFCLLSEWLADQKHLHLYNGGSVARHRFEIREPIYVW